MRIILGIILTATLFLSSYAGTVVLPTQSWLSITPVGLYFDSTFAVYHDSSNTLSCSSIKDSTDFYWRWYEGCTCLCACCPSITVASKRAFYVSRKPMNYSDYMGNPMKLADTNLFVRCATSGTSCPFASASLVGPLGLITGGVDSLYTRLLVFQTKDNLQFPLKIDRIVAKTLPCPYAGMSSAAYDSMQVTIDRYLIYTAAFARNAPSSRSAIHLATTRRGYVISGFGEGRGSLEIVNARGKTVYCRPVVSSQCVIGKNVLGPGIYFIQVHLQAGTSSIVLPVH